MYRVEIAYVDTSWECAGHVRIWLWSIDFDKAIPLEKKNEIFSFHSLTFIWLKLRSNDFWQLSPLKLEKIKHGFKTLAECGGIRGVDDTSSFPKFMINLYIFSNSINMINIISL
jgi:hypothetical protein